MFNLIGCKDPTSIKVNDEHASEYVKSISQDLDSATASEFKAEFKFLMQLNAAGGDLAIISRYSKKYEHIELGDILEEVQSRKPKSSKK